MTQKLEIPQKIQSDSVVFTPGGTVTIKKDFLEPTLQMGAPVMRRAKLRTQLNITTPATGQPSVALGGMLSHVYSKVLVKDRSGQRVNASGGALRALAQQELGWGYLDPPPISDGQTLNVEFYLPLLFVLGDKAATADDTGIAIPDFYAGGEITLNFVDGDIGPGNAAGPNITVNSGTISVCAEVIDEGTPEVKSRLSILEQALINSDSSYPLNGKIRTSLIYVGETNEEAGTVWGSAGNTLESRSFDYISLPQSLFVEDYIEEGYNDPTTDMVINGFVLPMYSPHRGAKITRQPVFNDLHVKFSQATPAGATLITVVYTQRSASSIALSLRNASAAEMQALGDGGGVVPGNSGSVALASIPQSQRKYLPIRLGLFGGASSPKAPAAQAVT